MSSIGWIQLAKFPLKKKSKCSFSEAIQINANEFIVAPFTPEKGIYKYQSNNKWKIFAKYPKYFKSSAHTLSYDVEKGILYLFSHNGQMTQINVKTKKFIISKKLTKTRSYASSIVVNSKVHIVADSHLLWNPIVKALKTVQNVFNNTKCSGLVHIKDKNILLLIGGTSSNIINKYDFNTNEWSKVGNIPNIEQFGYVVVGNDERYLILLGGNNSNIKVIDLETMVKFDSRILCPIGSGNFRAVLMDNSARAAIILVAFIRKYFDAKNNRIPEDVFHLMVIWVISHDIHLLSKKNGMHWRIDAYEILKSVGLGV